MDITKRINKKYKKELEHFMQTDNPFEAIEALEAIFYREDFTRKDYFDFLDYLAKVYKDDQKITSLGDKNFSLERMVLGTDMTEYLEDWDIDTQNKYFGYFKSKENMMSLADWPEPIFDYYKDDLNWDIILYNTFFIEWDNYDAYTLILIEKYQREIFEENESGYHVAADAFFFFHCFMIGIQFDTDFLVESIIKGTSRFSKYILINNLLDDYYSRDIELDGNRVLKHDIISERFETKLTVTIEPLLARLVKQPDIIELIEGNQSSSSDDSDFNF